MSFLSTFFKAFVFGVMIVQAIEITNIAMEEENDHLFAAMLETDVATSLFTEYEAIRLESDMVTSLRSTETSQSRFHKIFFYRLKSNTTYIYQIFSTDSDLPLHRGSFTTKPLTEPLAFRNITVVYGEPTYDLAKCSYNIHPDLIYFFDEEGEVVWWVDAPGRPQSLQRSEEGDIVMLHDAGLINFSPSGRIQNSWDVPRDCNFLGIHHELYVGRLDEPIYTLGQSLEEMPGYSLPQLVDTVLRLNRETGEYEEILNLAKFLDVNDRTFDSDSIEQRFICGEQVLYQDWTHANGIDVRGSTIMLSLRHMDAIVLFREVVTGDGDLVWILEWQMGGQNSDWAFPDTSDRFYHLHRALWTGPDTIVMFDNGNGRPEAFGGRLSRGLELKLNYDDMEVSSIWQFQLCFADGKCCYSNCCGSVSRLLNRNTVVQFPLCDVDMVGYTAEIDQHGDLISLISQNVQEHEIGVVTASPADTIGGEIIINSRDCNIEINGRSGFNSVINGVYTKSGLHEDKLIYEKSRDDLSMLWTDDRWRIVRGTDEFAYSNVNNENSPDQTKQWAIWNGTNFVLDSQVVVQCEGEEDTSIDRPLNLTAAPFSLSFPPFHLTRPSTQAKTTSPTRPPTQTPTQNPTKTPTQTLHPTSTPTQTPTSTPTHPPTQFSQPPSAQPTKQPSKQPTKPPTKTPTQPPTKTPTQPPTKTPTQPPTKLPTKQPTQPPTKQPTSIPTKIPKIATKVPTKVATKLPTKPATKRPTKPPTAFPTRIPIVKKTSRPTEIVTDFPTVPPAPRRTATPTSRRTIRPTAVPTPKRTSVPRPAHTAPPTSPPSPSRRTRSRTPRPTDAARPRRTPAPIRPVRPHLVL